MDGKPTTFITLTVNPAEGETKESRARALSDAWKIVVKRARRKWTKAPLEYLAVFEETKRGEPHLHILARAPFIPQRWLSDQMAELIKAPIVDIRRVGHVKNAARYVAKYVAKGPKPFASLKRYWQTRGYDLVAKLKVKHDTPWGSGWRMIREPLVVLADLWRSHCRQVIWNGEHEMFSPAGHWATQEAQGP